MYYRVGSINRGYLLLFNRKAEHTQKAAKLNEDKTRDTYLRLGGCWREPRLISSINSKRGLTK